MDFGKKIPTQCHSRRLPTLPWAKVPWPHPQHDPQLTNTGEVEHRARQRQRLTAGVVGDLNLRGDGPGSHRLKPGASTPERGGGLRNCHAPDLSLLARLSLYPSLCHLLLHASVGPSVKWDCHWDTEGGRGGLGPPLLMTTR